MTALIQAILIGWFYFTNSVNDVKMQAGLSGYFIM